MRFNWKPNIARDTTGSRLYVGSLSFPVATTVDTHRTDGWRVSFLVPMSAKPDTFKAEDDAKAYAERTLMDWFKQCNE